MAGKPLHIVANACTLRVAGGLSIGLNFFRAFSKLSSRHKITAFVPSGLGYEALESENLTIIPIPSKLQKASFRLYLDHVWLPGYIKKLNPDVVFSMGNIALPIQNIKQILFFHWAYAVYPEGPFWDQMPLIPKLLRKLRVRQFAYYLPYASKIIVQGKHIQKRLSHYYQIPEQQIVIIQSAIDTNYNKSAKPAFSFKETYPSHLILGYLSRFYSHKNFEILLQAARIFKAKNIPVKILLTLERSHGKESIQFLDTLNDEGLEEILVNVGQLSTDLVSGFYNSIDALVFPSLLETLGLPQVEAMMFGKPVLAADLDYAHEVNGDAAFFFNPLDAENLVQLVESILHNPKLLAEKASKSQEQFQKFKAWNEVTQSFLEAIEALAYAL